MVEDFWEWLPKAYRDGDLGDEPVFTKYNMETAFAAGAEAEAKRMWVGLTDEERAALLKQATYMDEEDCEHLLMLAEAKLKAKNAA